MLRYVTTGESHGKTLAAILEGMPSGLAVNLEFINGDLARRQQGYGRGGRQKIETDRVEILKVHGTYVLVGDGYKKVWKLWPGGKDLYHYEPLKLEPGAGGFSQPTLEASGNCALLKWQKGASPAQAFVNSDGAFNDKNCP